MPHGLPSLERLQRSRIENRIEELEEAVEELKKQREYMAKTLSGKFELVYDEGREKYGISLADGNEINYQFGQELEGKEVIITIFEVKK